MKKPSSVVYNTDCLPYMKSLPDKYFDIGVVDVPYGLKKSSVQGSGKLKGRTLNSHDMSWDVQPPQEYWDELFRISKNQIIWGGNYFSLPPCRCFVIWDKQQVWENFSQCEYAWTSFDKPAKLVTISNRGGSLDKINWHPTAKPVELYVYLLKTFAKPGDIIFDSHMGSAPSRIAAYKMGYDFIGCELNSEFFQKAQERFEEECLGVHHTKSGKTVVEQSLF
jgi:site-specific DNA-methyltransferase (adenine-specific)